MVHAINHLVIKMKVPLLEHLSNSRYPYHFDL